VAQAFRPAWCYDRAVFARRLLWLVCCLTIAGSASARVWAWQQRRAPGSGIPLPTIDNVQDDRLERLERWITLAARHTPGEDDQELEEIAAWPNAHLKSLWVDASALVQLMRSARSGSGTMSAGPQERRTSVQVRYTKIQFQRMRELACAAGGMLVDAECLELKAADHLDPALRQVAALASASNQRGDRNYILRRGALLHTDVPLLAPIAMDASSDSRSVAGPDRFRMAISDGREVNLAQSAVHWEIARMLLDRVVPRGGDRAAPAGDEMVRAWYYATAAWMQLREDHDKEHLDHARQIYPADPDFLLLAGFQRETFAGSPVQNAVRSAVLPTGVTLDVGSEKTELRDAEAFFQRALVLRPDHAEGRMHHGRVLALLGRHADAVVELRRAAAALPDPFLGYYAQLFLGAEEETIGNREAARAAYEQAAVYAPRAQSPLLALSQLARRYGDRPGALGAMDRLYAIPEEGEGEHDDPWWWYTVSQARDADDLLDALREPFRSERLQ
jgi:tetratricopeptide (TPR) repeat protein